MGGQSNTGRDVKSQNGHTKTHDHDDCITAAIERAEEMCAAAGTRFTDLRRQVLEHVWSSHKAIKAYDILEIMSKDGGNAKPPTVYRALDFLMEHGLVHKIESLNAFVGCPFVGDDHVSQFLICDSCADVMEIASSDLRDSVRNAASASGFVLKGQTIELHGTCQACAENV